MEKLANNKRKRRDNGGQSKIREKEHKRDTNKTRKTLE